MPLMHSAPWSRGSALLLLTTALMAPLGAPGIAAAQTATDGKPSTVLPEVVVTSGKRVQRLQDVPASIVAETGLDLDHRGATQLADIISNTPGLSNPSPGPSNQTNLTIRGVTTGASNGLKQNTVAQLYDDIPLDPGSQGAGTTNLRLVDVQRVEVLRGPQGTLFGSGSLAGAIRYVTNKPDLTTYSGLAEVNVADTVTGAASYYGNLTANIPLVQDKVALRVVGYGYDDGGFVYDLKTGQSNINSTETYGGRVTLRARPIERLTADFTVMYQNSKDHASADSLDTKPAGVTHGGQVTDGVYEPTYYGTNAIVGANVQYDFQNFSVISQTTYHVRKNGQAGVDYYFVPLTVGIATGFSKLVNGPDTASYFVNAKNFTQEIRLASRGAGPLKWTVGAFYLDSQNHSSQEDFSSLVTPYIGGNDIVNLIQTGSQSEIAGFGEATYTLFNQLDFTAGVRVSQTTLKNTVTTGGFIPVFSVNPAAFVTEHFPEKDTPVTPHFSVDWRVNPSLSLYAAAARGYRVGGVNETSGVGGRASPPSYGPDSLWNYEGGVKGKLFHGKFTYSADVYYIDWTNLQVNLQNNLGNYTGNAGAATLYGFEGQFAAHPTNWLEVGASLNVSSNTISKTTPGLSTAIGVITVTKGSLIAASPESQAAAYSEVHFDVAGHPAYVRANANYTGVEYTGFAKAGTKFGDYAATDLRAGIHLDRYEVIAYANNIFDSQGKQSALDPSSVGPIVINGQYVYRIRPLTFGLTLRASF